MREIKFRAWLESLQVMVSVHKIEFLDDGNYKIFFKNLQDGKYIDCALAPSSMISRSSTKGDRFALMQYTGLKDKNGKEIYESDIVKYKTISRTLPYNTAPVVFFEGAFRLSESRIFTLRDYLSADLEVVGNIYKNPELLGRKKNEK